VNDSSAGSNLKIVKDGVEMERTIWDKAAPTGPPTPVVRRVPRHLEKIYAWIRQIVADEGMVADLALERAIEIVQFQHDRGLVGIDYFPEANPGGMAATRMNMVALAVPLAVEIYKQAEGSIGQKADEFTELVKEAALLAKATKDADSK
jgi:hypothetical protein